MASRTLKLALHVMGCSAHAKQPRPLTCSLHVVDCLQTMPRLLLLKILSCRLMDCLADLLNLKATSWGRQDHRGDKDLSKERVFFSIQKVMDEIKPVQLCRDSRGGKGGCLLPQC